MVKKEIKIQNIVASASLEHDIPLIKLAEALPNTEYNPEQFPGLVMRIKEPKTSALIFSSGKIVCTGAKSMSKVKQAVAAIIKHIEKKLNIKVGETTKDGMFTLKAVECLGSCGTAPMMQIGASYHENLTYDKVDSILDKYKAEGKLRSYTDLDYKNVIVL